MIKFILRKTVFKKYDKQTQDHLLPLLSKKYTIMWFCCFIFHFIFIIAPMLLLLMSVYGKEFDSAFNIALGTGIAIYECLLGSFYLFFTKDIIDFSTNTLPDTLYNRLYAQRGNAISKQDFKKIEQENNILHKYITSCLCHGHCYSICFAILETLKTGKMKFLAVKKLNTEDGKETYTMHVLYENNGWTFDTYNQRQYLVEKNIALHKGIVYKDFSYEDIKGLSYEEFRDKNYEELARWCKEHDCFQSWKKKDD